MIHPSSMMDDAPSMPRAMSHEPLTKPRPSLINYPPRWNHPMGKRIKPQNLDDHPVMIGDARNPLAEVDKARVYLDSRVIA